MQCAHFDARRCTSCAWMGQDHQVQLAAKQDHCRQALADHPDVQWLPPVAGPDHGFRNKAKMVVGGTAERPTLGILDGAGRGVDLSDCGLYPPALQASFAPLTAFITLADLAPYDVPRRTGELKFVLITLSPDDELMVRFVLRSQESVARIRKHLPALRAALPRLAVASVNLLPEHKAVVEGEREILLTEAETLRMRLDDVDLHLRPQSFFQTNTGIARALYRQASAWVDDQRPTSVWDLYCGVGGFALHCARPDRDVVGVESSAEAVASARLTAAEAGLDRVRFEVGDATAFALAAPADPDTVVVNPPRRGIGPVLAQWLERSSVRHVVYSSCNAASLARDLAAMPSLRPRRAQVLDMFPQTSHYEVLVDLTRTPSP